jgi:UDP-N-acetylglucosamine 1-carboxyvinyltransferase
LGAHDSVDNGMIDVHADELKGDVVFFDTVSVGATINAMLAAVMADGLTVLENVAKEPHIVDVANFLNTMGADVRGAGTDVIKIRGVKKMHGCTYSIIPDQIEAGSYMVCAAITGGNILVKNVIPKHLEPITSKLEKAGATVEEFDDAVRVCRTGDIEPLNIKTMPHPGFPTDMQPLMTVLLALAKGTSIVTEGVWENRFRYVDELARMGTNIQVAGSVAVIEGVPELLAAPMRATDLRAGAALVMAALTAKGVSEIDEISHIERGYEDIVEKLQGLGADIRRVEKPAATLRTAL